jgi:hypothetical protein|nr:MAG TPA: hypothetical protein [Caudoviricetes sp.]
MADQFENQLPQKSDAKWVRALDASGNPILISKEDLASVVGGLIGPASALKDGLLSHILYQNLFSSKTDSTEDMDLIGTGYYAIHSDYNIPKNNKSGIKYGSFISLGSPVGGNAAGGNAQIQIAIGNDGTRRIRNRWLNNWTEWVTF